MVRRLLIGTRSAGKRREIRELLRSTPLTLLFPDDLGLQRLPEEDQLETAASFHENAIRKARYFAQRSGLATVADDSGIEVDALGGAPGVRSARWGGEAGPNADVANNELLLKRLAGIPPERRTARYRCVVAYLEQVDAEPRWVEGSAEGTILEAPAGTGGFGYDPLFFSSELGRSFGEVTSEAKHAVSHRGRAFRKLIALLMAG